MTQITLHCFNVVSGADRGNCVGMAQVVETGIGTTDGRNNALVLTIDCRLCQVRPELVGKDQPLRILPVTAQQKLLLHLPSALLLQPGQYSLRCGDGAASSILRRNKLIALAPLVLMQLHLLFHRDDTCMKVDAVPRQTQYLALTHTGEQRQDKQCFKAVSLYSGQKCRDLSVIKRLDFLTLYPRQDTGIGRVVSQIADQYRLLKCLVENAMDILHRFRGKTLRILLGRLSHSVVKCLYHRCVQCLQPHRTQRWQNVQPDIGFIDVCRSGLHAAQVGL